MSVSTTLSQELVDALGSVVRAARSYAHLKHEQLGASNVTLAILTRLQTGPARPGDLAEALCVNPSAISRALAVLDELDYVTRTPDPRDARAQTISLAPAGQEVLRAQHEAYAESLASVLDAWDEARARVVVDGLQDLERVLSTVVADLRHGAPALIGDPARRLVEADGRATGGSIR